MNARQNLGALFIILSGLGSSVLPLFGVAAFASGTNVITMLSTRFGTASLCLWLLTLLRRERLPDLKTGLQLLGLGSAGYAVMSSLYLSSVDQDRLSPSIAALLLYTYPIIVAALTWLNGGESLSRKSWMSMTLTLAGVVLVLVTPGEKTRVTFLGSALASASAVVYSIYIIVSNRVTHRTTPLLSTSLICSGAALSFVSIGFLTNTLQNPHRVGWHASLGAGLISTVFAILLFFDGLRRLGPVRTSLLCTVEPVGTVLFSAAFLGQVPTLTQVAGGLLVLSGILFLLRSKGSPSH